MAPHTAPVAVAVEFVVQPVPNVVLETVRWVSEERIAEAWIDLMLTVVWVPDGSHCEALVLGEASWMRNLFVLEPDLAFLVAEH